MGRIIANADPVKLAKVQNRMTVAAKIADAMKAKNLNQKQFAQLMGRTESEISDWLSGDRNFTIDTLLTLVRLWALPSSVRPSSTQHQMFMNPPP